MSGLTATAESDTITDVVFSGTGTAYLALHTSDPGNTPDGSTEISDTGYSRVEISESDWTENGNEPTALTNDTEYTFNSFDTDVGDITHGSITAGSSGGDYRVTGAVSPVKTFDAGDAPRYEANAITFEIQ